MSDEKLWEKGWYNHAHPAALSLKSKAPEGEDYKSFYFEMTMELCKRYKGCLEDLLLDISTSNPTIIAEELVQRMQDIIRKKPCIQVIKPTPSVQEQPNLQPELLFYQVYLTFDLDFNLIDCGYPIYMGCENNSMITIGKLPPRQAPARRGRRCGGGGGYYRGGGGGGRRRGGGHHRGGGGGGHGRSDHRRGYG